MFRPQFAAIIRERVGRVDNPSPSKGAKTWCRNSVRSVRPVTAIKSTKPVAFRHFVRTSTWCRLGANLRGDSR